MVTYAINRIRKCRISKRMLLCSIKHAGINLQKLEDCLSEAYAKRLHSDESYAEFLRLAEEFERLELAFERASN